MQRQLFGLLLSAALAAPQPVWAASSKDYAGPCANEATAPGSPQFLSVDVRTRPTDSRTINLTAPLKDKVMSADGKVTFKFNGPALDSIGGYLVGIAEDPKFCCLVMMEDSAVVNGHLDTGGMLAAPLFAKIAERAARQIGLQPDPVLLEEELAFRKTLAKEGR